MKKLIRYRLPVSRRFPATHPRKGELTYFIPKIELSIGQLKLENNCMGCIIDECDSCFLRSGECWPKLHTCRSNYDLWKKRFDKINSGEAVLELYYWSGSPYNYKRDGSKQVVFATLTKEDGIGIQKFRIGEFYDEINDIERAYYSIDDRAKFDLLTSTIAKNDGLSLEDWKAWFKGYDLSEPMAIIHFTSFRY